MAAWVPFNLGSVCSAGLLGLSVFAGNTMAKRADPRHNSEQANLRLDSEAQIKKLNMI